MEQLNNIEGLPVIEVPYLEHEVEQNEDSSVQVVESSSRSFIQANTIPATLEEIKEKHIIPVWAKSNETLISHADFIEHTYYIVKDIFHGEQILPPSIRLSHPIKGRIPEAKSKPAEMLEDHERTLWYERMMFCVEIPSINAEVGGNPLSLTIGGVKSFGEDNLYQNSNGDQHFTIFIGYKNLVCTNLCVWSDGINSNIAVKGLSGLIINIHSLIRNYNSSHHIHHLQRLPDYNISEKLFSQLIGKLRMYQFLPTHIKKNIEPMLLGDQQISAVVRDYYRDKSFCRSADGTINLWRLYNLFTGVNRSSYIDSFLDRGVNAYSFVENIRWVLEGKKESWYLN